LGKFGIFLSVSFSPRIEKEKSYFGQDLKVQTAKVDLFGIVSSKSVD